MVLSKVRSAHAYTPGVCVSAVCFGGSGGGGSGGGGSGGGGSSGGCGVRMSVGIMCFGVAVGVSRSNAHSGKKNPSLARSWSRQGSGGRAVVVVVAAAAAAVAVCVCALTLCWTMYCGCCN